MAVKGKTVSDAAHEWVREMNAYPRDMIETLMEASPDDWSEVTLPSKYDEVYVYSLEDYGEIEECLEDGEYRVVMGSGVIIIVEDYQFEVRRDSILPMWGWLWSFGDSCDEWWLEEDDGIKLMSECGFRIYKHDEWGYFFGIDGAGYSFYDEHWIPLYRKRGLQWHDPETEE